MKPNELIRSIRKAARAKRLDAEIVREGSRHTIWRVGTITFPVPRHEIGPKLEFEIRASLEPVLGKRWWR